MTIHTLWTPVGGLVGKTIKLNEIFDIGENEIKIGDIINAIHPHLGHGCFIALCGVTGLESGRAVAYNAYTGVTTRTLISAHGNKGFPIAISLTNNTSASKLSWFQISGNAIALSPNALMVADSSAYITATAGVLDDAVVVGAQIVNAYVATANIETLEGINLGSNRFILNINNPATQTGAAA